MNVTPPSHKTRTDTVKLMYFSDIYIRILYFENIFQILHLLDSNMGILIGVPF